MARSRSGAKKRTVSARPRESADALAARGSKILRALQRLYPQPKTALLHDNPFQLLVATILSAQCTDERVNIVTRELFKTYRSPSDIARVNPAVLEKEIRSTGFFRMKAKNLIACCRALEEHHGGKVPQDMDALVALPGVGRKTANVVLGQAFGIVSGIVVDTHVHRVTQRLRLTVADDPVTIEQDLMTVFEKKYWIDLGTLLILHGRAVCQARKPKCPECDIREWCPSATLFQKGRP